MSHPALEAELKPWLELYKQVEQKALQRLNLMKLDVPELKDPNSQFYNKPEKYAMWRFSYFLCYKCKVGMLCVAF